MTPTKLSNVVAQAPDTEVVVIGTLVDASLALVVEDVEPPGVELDSFAVVVGLLLVAADDVDLVTGRSGKLATDEERFLPRRGIMNDVIAT